MPGINIKLPYFLSHPTLRTVAVFLLKKVYGSVNGRYGMIFIPNVFKIRQMDADTYVDDKTILYLIMGLK
jgi:hypothetical protein